MARQTRSPLARAWMLAVTGLASVGCTMCPDPLDYSGPVPNGSAPQNDFRARSGGILPLGATPMPFPLIVKGEGQPDEPESIPAGTAEVVSGIVSVEEDELRKTVTVVGESEAEPDGQPEATVLSASDAVVTNVRSRPEPVTAATKVSPLPAGETPGWRSRRR